MKKLFALFIFITLYSCSEDSFFSSSSENLSSKTNRLSGTTETLSVMSYNVYQMPSIAPQYKSKERAAELYKYIINLGVNSPDVLVIEEGFNARFGDEFLAKIKTLYPYATPLLGLYCSSGGGTNLYPNNWDGYFGSCGNTIFHVNGGTIILSKYPIEKKYQLVFQNKINSIEGMSNRGVAYAVVVKNNKRYHIFGTHTASEQPGYPGRTTREKQFTEMRNFKNYFNIPVTEPVIYAGDMNVEYTLTSEYQNMLSILFGGINYSFNPIMQRGTYSNQNTVVQYQGYNNYNDTLDYIFYSKEHKLPAFEPVMQQFLAKYWGGDVSDHDPVYIQYTFNY